MDNVTIEGAGAGAVAHHQSASPTTLPIAATAQSTPSAYVPAAQVISNSSMAASAPTVVVVAPQNSGPGLLVRGLYFLFLGVWLGAFCTALAWLLNVTIIGLPLGLMVINRLPQIMTLKTADSRVQVTVQGGVVLVQQGRARQHSFFVRALYFLLVGWWASALWLGVAWGLLGATLGLGFPLAFWMFNRTPAMTTLAR